MENVSSSNGLELYPKLRFKDSEDNSFPQWKTIKLKKILSQRIVKQTPTEEAPLMAFIANCGVSTKGNRYDRSYLVKNDNKLYKRTEIDDFIYSSNNLDVGSIGLNDYGTAVISDVYEIFSINNLGIPSVINDIIQQPYNMNQIIKYRQGCLYGQYRINPTDFLNVSVNIPCIEEQIKIADFFKYFDQKIAQQTKLIDDLKKYKRGLIRKYFEEKGTWKKVPFWDCVEIASSLVDPTIEPYMYMPHIGTANIEKFTGRLLPCKKAYEEGLTSGKYLFNSECIIYSKIRPELSKVAYPGFTGICSADAYPLKPKEGIMPEIIYYELLSERFVQFATKTSTRTKMPKINQEELSGFSFLIPPLEVQKEIIPFLRKFDLHLLYQEEELQNYVKIKKSLIQQLFI